MIQANELRIFNLVDRTNKLTKEKLRIEITASCILDISANGDFSSFIYEPIPLTEELLLRLGFESNPYQDRYELEGINIECNNLRKDDINLWIEFMPHIKYVHQLQNLYFILKNKELTLKP